MKTLLLDCKLLQTSVQGLWSIAYMQYCIVMCLPSTRTTFCLCSSVFVLLTVTDEIFNSKLIAVILNVTYTNEYLRYFVFLLWQYQKLLYSIQSLWIFFTKIFFWSSVLMSSLIVHLQHKFHQVVKNVTRIRTFVSSVFLPFHKSPYQFSLLNIIGQ